jgi:hypothetical protein
VFTAANNRITVDEKFRQILYWRSVTDANTQSRSFPLIAEVLGALPLRRAFAVLALAVLSLLVSYAIVAVSPDRAPALKPGVAATEAPATPAH